jgi:hypothetical protein
MGYIFGGAGAISSWHIAAYRLFNLWLIKFVSERKSYNII